MLLPLTVSCFSKIQIGFTFLVPAHLGSPGQGAVCVCVCVRVCVSNVMSPVSLSVLSGVDIVDIYMVNSLLSFNIVDCTT